MRAAGKIEYVGPKAETSCHPVETATLCHARSVAHGFTLLKPGRSFPEAGYARPPAALSGHPEPRPAVTRDGGAAEALPADAEGEDGPARDKHRQSGQHGWPPGLRQGLAAGDRKTSLLAGFDLSQEFSVGIHGLRPSFSDQRFAAADHVAADDEGAVGVQFEPLASLGLIDGLALGQPLRRRRGSEEHRREQERQQRGKGSLLNPLTARGASFPSSRPARADRRGQRYWGA